MTTRSIHDLNLVEHYIAPQAITDGGGAIVGGDIDLNEHDSAMIAILFGDIDELGGSPVGAANITVLVEVADDDGTGNPGAYGNAEQRVIDGQTIASGAYSVTTDVQPSTFGIISEKRFARVTLTPSGLTNGGNVAVGVVRGHAHLTPVSNT